MGRSGAAYEGGVGGDGVAFHDDAMREDVCVVADFDTVEDDGVVADGCAGGYADAVDFEDAVFEAVGLEVAGDSRVVAELEHVGIDDLCEAGAQCDAAADADAEEAQDGVEQECALEGRERAAGPDAPGDVEEIPAAAPAGPERVLAWGGAA